MKLFTVFMVPKKAYSKQLPSYQMLLSSDSPIDACYAAKIIDEKVFATVDPRYKTIFAKVTAAAETMKIE